MKIRRQQRIRLLFLIGVVVSIAVSCRLYDDRMEIKQGDEYRFYSYDPETILDQLAQKNTDVFTLVGVTSLDHNEEYYALRDATPEIEPPTPQQIADWGYEDYLLMAQTLYEQSWGEPMGDQNLYKMLFHINCAEAENGTFKNMGFHAFENIQVEGEEETRIERWIFIEPEKNSIYSAEIAYQPNVNYKEPIKVSKFLIGADEALKIAEDNGGREERNAIGNECDISVMITDPDSKEWRIIYAPDGFTQVFRITVNALTGKYKVLYSTLN